MRKLLLAVSLTGLVAAGGCASAQAKGKPADRPALSVPPAPDRLIEPAEIVPDPVPVPDLPSSPSAPPNGASSRPPRRENQPRPEAPKPTDPKIEPVAEVPPKPESKPAEVGAELRTPQTADTSGAAKAVRTTIDTARGLLNGVNFGVLSNERKKAYNDAKLLMQQAEDALKEGNLGIAQGVATKAETLARELAGR